MSTMELSWSQTPGKVWYALDGSSSFTNLGLDDLRSPASPTRSIGGTLRPEEQSKIFYNYADDTDYKESEEEIAEWIKEYRTRGVIRYKY